MKKLFSVLASLFIAGIVFSQSTVTINTTGNRNKQVLVDNKAYTITNTYATEEQNITISDLAAGQHSLDVVRLNNYNSRVSTKTYFTLRDGYNLTITINLNGAVSTAETRVTRDNANNGKPISTAAYNKLYSQTKAKTTSTSRSTFLENEFTNTNKRFTATQASQLIQLVNSESLRFKLAKQSYSAITDRQNFNLVSNLLNSNANKTELANYIATVDLDDDDYAASDMGAPMTAQQFSTIYNEVYAENTSSDRDYYLRNFFGRENTSYTATQVAQLIRLVTGEEERFNLTKTAYRNTVDKENYATVSQVLNTNANRSALTAYINSYNNSNPNTNVYTAMSATDFDRLYSSAYYQSNSLKYSTINTAFTTQGNYFTVAQAKKLIPLVTSESNRLALAKAAYPVLVDRVNYTQFNEFLYSAASETDLYNYATNYNNNYPVGTGATGVIEFNTLYQKVNTTWDQVTRLSLVGDAFTYSNRYTTDQVRQLLLLINTEADRLPLAKNSYDNVTDKENFSRIYDVFTYNSSYRNDLASYVSIYGGTGTVITRVAMTESEYNSLYRSVQLSFGFGAKMSVLTEIFNKESNYFTVEQAKQLIRLVSDEDNRLALAKSSYNNIVDTENFGNIYDIFSSQSSKDALKTYVNSNVYVN